MEGSEPGMGLLLPGLPSLYAPQPISDQPMRLGFPHRAGGVDPGELDFRPRVAHVLHVPATQRSAIWIRVSTPCGAVSTGDFRPRGVVVVEIWRNI